MKNGEITDKNKNRALYVGVDVHRYTNTAVAANRFEEKLGELTFDNTRTGIEKFLGWLGNLDNSERVRIVGLEGSGGYGKLLTQLTCGTYSHVYEVNPIFTRQRRAFGTKGDKSDPVDASLITQVLTRQLEKLPRLALQDQSDLLVALGQLVVFHDNLTRFATRLKNQLRRLYHQLDPSWSKTRKKAFSKKSLGYWKAKAIRLGKSDKLPIATCALGIKQKVTQLTRINTAREEIDQKIEYLLAKTGSQLTSLPGVGTITAAKILANTKGVERFPTVDKFVKYAGIAPVERSSGKTKKHRQARGGNRQLNTAIYTVALIQMRCVDKAKEYFAKKVSEGKSKKHAMRCLMKRMSCIIYGMMKTGEFYQEERQSN